MGDHPHAARQVQLGVCQQVAENVRVQDAADDQQLIEAAQEACGHKLPIAKPVFVVGYPRGTGSRLAGVYGREKYVDVNGERALGDTPASAHTVRIYCRRQCNRFGRPRSGVVGRETFCFSAFIRKINTKINGKRVRLDYPLAPFEYD